jgi:TonB family protein
MKTETEPRPEEADLREPNTLSRCLNLEVIRVSMRLLFFAPLFAVLPMAAQAPALDWQGWLAKGTEAYKSAHYREAAEAFQQSVQLNPTAVTPRLYLATSWMAMYIPAGESPESREIARKAEDGFRSVLQLEPNNRVALQSIASLMFQEAQGNPDASAKPIKLEEAARWYEKLLVADPRNRDAYYSLAVIDWTNWYAADMDARSKLGLRPEQPGPLPDVAMRQRLSQQCSAQIEHGIASLQKALEIDPQFGDAMAYMNLLIRERADLRDTVEEYKRDVETADIWVQKSIMARKGRGAQSIVGALIAPPPPPPPPPTMQRENEPGPKRIRVSGNVQEFNLIRKANPIYPALAKQARIQGTVQFTAIIGKDGHIQNLELLSGHPLLVESAVQAVKLWEYKPTLLNGEPVEVVTQVFVNYTLAQDYN